MGGFVALDVSLCKERRRRALQIRTDTLSSYIIIMTAMTTAAAETTAAARGEKKRQPTTTTKLGQLYEQTLRLRNLRWKTAKRGCRW